MDRRSRYGFAESVRDKFVPAKRLGREYRSVYFDSVLLLEEKLLIEWRMLMLVELASPAEESIVTELLCLWLYILCWVYCGLFVTAN